MTDDLNKFIEEFQLDYAAQEEQRDGANAEIRFAMVPGGQWEGYLEDDYENRAKLEVDQTSDYLYRTYAQWVDNRQSPTFSPDDDIATDDDSELLEGLLRKDIRRENGQAAIDTAIFEAMACGQGAFLVSTMYEDDEDEDNQDQVSVLKQISNAYSMVVWDSSATRADKADAGHCTVLLPYSIRKFKQKWPDADPSSTLQPQDRRWFNWSNASTGDVYVACRYNIERKNVVVYTFANIVTGERVKLEGKEYDEEKAELLKNGFVELSKRKVNRRQVFKTLFTGSGILEKPRRIAGKYIPVIPVYGYRAFIDGTEFTYGVIRKRMDGQRLLNASISLAAESAAHGPEDKPLFAPEQMQNPAVRAQWAKNRHQLPYLLADPLYDESGETILMAGPTGMIPGATLSQASQVLIGFANDFIKTGTGGAPADIVDTEASGKALNTLYKRVDMNTRMIFDNISASLVHFGKVWREMASEIYTDRTGRKAKTIMVDGQIKDVTLMALSGEGGELGYRNDLSKGRFEAVVEIGASYETEREEAISALKDILEAIMKRNPADPLADIILNKIILELPSHGMDDIKDYVRRKQLLAGVIKPETKEDVEILQQAGIQAGEDPQKKLIEAATANEEAGAAKRVKEMEKLDADIQHTRAETEAQIIENQVAKSGIGSLLEQLNQLEQA